MHGQLTVTTFAALLCLSAHAQAVWITLDDFSGQGPIGVPNWYQATPLENFQMDNGRLFTLGKAIAIHQTFSQTDGQQRIRFEAYSGLPGDGTRDASVQTVSALLAAQDPTTYYEVRLLADNLLSTDFYRLHFYSIVGGSATNNLTIDFDADFDALRLDALITAAAVTVSIQPFERASGLDMGAPLSYSFDSVAPVLTANLDTARVGLAAQGRYMEIDNFQGFVLPEATTFITAALASLPLLRARRRKQTPS